jgi:hypothetical protein
MRKAPSKITEADVWNTDSDTTDASTPEMTLDLALSETPAHTPEPYTASAEFDLEGLMNDFPTATELERFVYDQTGLALNLKGRSNKLKYQVAMDVLNGLETDPKFISGDNPYLDRAEMVPQEPLKPIPARDASLPPENTMQNIFHSFQVPHPDFEQRANDAKVVVAFRKYDSGQISYEIMGPLVLQAHGEKLDKFGRHRAEIMRWLDPRTGERLMQRADGSLTPMGQRLKALMQKHKVWERYIDREFATLNQAVIDNPWGDN